MQWGACGLDRLLSITCPLTGISLLHEGAGALRRLAPLDANETITASSIPTGIADNQDEEKQAKAKRRNGKQGKDHVGLA
jgi:hypothetical protein